MIVTIGQDLNDGQFHFLEVFLSKTQVTTKVASNKCPGGSCTKTASAPISDGSTFNGIPTMGGVRQLTPVIRTHLASDGHFIGCVSVRI